MRNHFLRASGVPSAGGGFSGVTDNLVFHIDAGNTDSYSGSGTTVNSLVGSITNDAFNSNITYSSDDGGAWVFDGWNATNPTGSGIEFPNASYFDFDDGSFTFEAWFKLEKNYLETIAGIYPYAADAGQYGWSFFAYSWNTYTSYGAVQRVQYVRTTSAYATPSNEDASLNDNGWNHLVFSLDKSGSYDIGKVYINNSLASTNNYTSITTMPFYSGTKFYVGGIAGWGSSYSFQDRISIVRLYKGKALTSSEVSTNYSQESSRYT